MIKASKIIYKKYHRRCNASLNRRRFLRARHLAFLLMDKVLGSRYGNVVSVSHCSRTNSLKHQLRKYCITEMPYGDTNSGRFTDHTVNLYERRTISSIIFRKDWPDMVAHFFYEKNFDTVVKHVRNNRTCSRTTDLGRLI